MITGGMFYDEAEDDVATADGLVNYESIGTGQVSAPTHFYKIVVAKNASDQWQAIGFVLANQGPPLTL